MYVPNVQASENVEKPDWTALLQEAHETQAKYSRTFVDYTTIRSDFLDVFTKEAMMSIFMEHMMIDKEQYKLASTDFSPYIIPSQEWTSFHIERSSDKQIVLKENNKEVSELMSPQRILRKIKLIHTEDGWRIRHLDWEVKEDKKTHAE